MRKVSTNPEVISHYIDQQLPSVTNRQGSLWFKGTRLYSYNSLLAIIDTANQVLCIDKDIKSYSNTTSKQTLVLSRATPRSYTKFIIPLDTTPEEVLMHYWNLVEGYIAKHIRANKLSYKHLIHHILTEAELFSDYTHIDKRSREYRDKSKLIKLLFKHKIL